MGGPDTRQLRLLLCAYVTAALGSSVIYMAAFLYAYWHDPWLTPRHTLYMRVWGNVGGLFSLIVILLAVIGITILAASPHLRWNWAVWSALSVLILSLFVCGLP